MRILALTIAAGLLLTANAFAQDRYVVIEAPQAVPIMTDFDLAVRFGGDGPSTRLRAELHAGTVCPVAGQGEPIATLATDARFSEPEQRVAVRVDGTIGAGPYSLCVWVDPPGSDVAVAASSIVTVEPIAPSRARPWTVATTRTAVSALGPLDLDAVDHARLQFLFGREASARRSLARGTGCVLRWSHLGLRLRLGYFGSAGTACVDGRIQSFTIGGRDRYGKVRTRKGLRLGDRVRRLRTLHPKAVKRSKSVWWLRSAVSRAGEPDRYAILAARIRDGRVHTFAGRVGAAGD